MVGQRANTRSKGGKRQVEATAAQGQKTDENVAATVWQNLDQLR